MSQSNVDVVREIYEGWSRGDFLSGVERFDRYVVLVLRPEFPDPGPYFGVQAIRGHMRNHLMADFDDARIDGEEYTEAGDTVVVRTRQTASGATKGLPLETSYYNLWTLRAGTVIRIESIMDRDEALAAAGVAG